MNSFDKDYVWPVVVVGGGPAGMMAAVTAARQGTKVLLLEKNPHPGKKLLISGGGRCNVTNNKPIVRDMIAEYKEDGKFLFSTFTQHGVKETIAWFKERGVDFKEENEGRLFPATEKAETIHAALVDELTKTNVEVLNNQAVIGVEFNKTDKLFRVELKSGEIITNRACVVATGGKARPETGSTGEGFLWLEKLGHTIMPSSSSLVPLATKNAWVNKLSGLTLTDIKLTVRVDGKKELVKKGKILFTHFGITGPTILNMSSKVGEFLSEGDTVIYIDLFPERDAGELKKYWQELFLNESNKKLKNVLAIDLPLSLVEVVLDELGIDGDTPCHSVASKDRINIFLYLKAVPLQIKCLLGADKAVVSDGGVDLTEIDFKTMQSKIVPGLFLVGDVLNINRPSGGYSLQICWSTGSVAGLQLANKS